MRVFVCAALEGGATSIDQAQQQQLHLRQRWLGLQYIACIILPLPPLVFSGCAVKALACAQFCIRQCAGLISFVHVRPPLLLASGEGAIWW
jgi:hypothetical protein